MAGRIPLRRRGNPEYNDPPTRITPRIPLVVVYGGQARKTGLAADLFAAPLAVLRHRRIVRSMVVRALEARYRGSLLGGLWALASPLFLIVVYTVFFGLFLNIRSGPGAGVGEYGLFVMAGLFPWMAISDAIAQSTNTVLENRVLVQKVVFPLEILPAVVVLTAIVTQLVGLVVLAGAILVVSGEIPVGLIALPILLVPQVLFTLGIAWFLASLGAFVRDLAHATGIFLTAWMLLTPILYPIDIVPEQFSMFLWLNPVTSIVAAYRAALLGTGTFGLDLLAYPTILGAALCLAGGCWFMRTKNRFSDVL